MTDSERRSAAFLKNGFPRGLGKHELRRGYQNGLIKQKEIVMKGVIRVVQKLQFLNNSRLKSNKVRLFQDFGFWNSLLDFSEKTGLWPVFSRAWYIEPKLRAHRVLEQAQVYQKTTPLFPAGFIMLLVLSCASGGGKGSWASYPAMPVRWNYRVGNVQVTVDHVREEAAAVQIGAIAETMLAAGDKDKFNGRIPLTLDIRVEQRSFLHSVELFNTIYLDCLIRDGEGQVLGREYQYSVGKRSIISSKEQRRLMDRVLKGILRARRKRDRKTRGQQKDNA
jgi:hypothetical protein